MHFEDKILAVCVSTYLAINIYYKNILKNKIKRSQKRLTWTVRTLKKRCLKKLNSSDNIDLKNHVLNQRN